MMTEFGEALKEALGDKMVQQPKKNKKKRNRKPEEHIWKDKSGNSVKMGDMSERDLKLAYKHAQEMLHNTSHSRPGKYKVKESVMEMHEMCNAELFMRYILYDLDIPGLKTTLDIVKLVDSMRQKGLTNSDPVTVLFTSVPQEYEKLTVDDLLLACFDKLGVINRKLVTNKFILGQGLWLTEDERAQLVEHNAEGKLIDIKDVIKTRLFLDDSVEIRLTPKGLTYSEFRAMIQLDQFPKISKLSTSALKTLRDKVLLLVANGIQYHIDKWERLSKQLVETAEKRGLVLCA